MSLRGQLARIGCFTETHLGEALTVRIVKEDAILLAGPDGIGFDHARPLHLKEETARTPRTLDCALVHGGLLWIELIVSAQGVANVRAESVQGRKANNGVHANYTASTTHATTEAENRRRYRHSLSAKRRLPFSYDSLRNAKRPRSLWHFAAKREVRHQRLI